MSFTIAWLRGLFNAPSGRSAKTLGLAHNFSLWHLMVISGVIC